MRTLFDLNVALFFPVSEGWQSTSMLEDTLRQELEHRGGKLISDTSELTTLQRALAMPVDIRLPAVTRADLIVILVATLGECKSKDREYYGEFPEWVERRHPGSVKGRSVTGELNNLDLDCLEEQFRNETGKIPDKHLHVSATATYVVHLNGHFENMGSETLINNTPYPTQRIAAEAIAYMTLSRVWVGHSGTQSYIHLHAVRTVYLSRRVERAPRTMDALKMRLTRTFPFLQQ